MNNVIPLVTEPKLTHLAEYGAQQWADSHVLQHASKHDWVVTHMGWGDFTLNVGDATLLFIRADSSTGEEAMMNRGWRFHGRSHTLSCLGGDFTAAWGKLVAVFGEPWKES